jgi:hypothetical protein
VVLYWCETSSFTLREEHRLRVFENRVLRRIFGPKRGEVRCAGHVARMREVSGAYNILVGKAEWRRPLGRPRRKWEDGIRMDLGEAVFGNVDWMYFSRDRDRWRALVNKMMSLRFP